MSIMKIILVNLIAIGASSTKSKYPSMNILSFIFLEQITQK